MGMRKGGRGSEGGNPTLSLSSSQSAVRLPARLRDWKCHQGCKHRRGRREVSMSPSFV
jgi:hypothetical protein